MESIPEILTRNSLKFIKFKRTKAKANSRNKKTKNRKVSESDRQFVNQILHRNGENNPRISSSGSKEVVLNSVRTHRLLNSDRHEARSSIPSYTDLLQITPDLKSISEQDIAKKIKRNRSNCLASIPGITSNKVVSLLHLSNVISVSSNFEGYFTYFIGPGNNDILIRKIMKRKKGWVKIPYPHTANFIWTQVKKSSIFDLLPRIPKVKKIALENKVKLPALLPDSMYAAIMPNNTVSSIGAKLYNRLEGNSELANKKRLFYNMVNYYRSQNKDPFKYIPLTFHITDGITDINFLKFIAKYQEILAQMKNDSFLNNCWVIKPGESTNRGTGITVSNELNEIAIKVNEKIIHQGAARTFIIQKYLYRPLLYQNRKFDIRCYALITCLNNNIQGYFYKEGYLRTSCQQYNINNITDKFIHLTNDAIQKNSANYGLFEDSNKLSYDDFQRYIDVNMREKINFRDKVHPVIKSIVKDTIIATAHKLNPQNRAHTFEILGYDFMIDEFFWPWLIEVNTNPCLELSGAYLKELIPNMLKHGFNIALDQVFTADNITFSGNDFELIFSENK